MGVKRIGFVGHWMSEEPEVAETSAASLPDGLQLLREKIAAKAIFIISSGFAKLRKAERFEVLAEFVELQAIEADFARAVE